MKIIETQIEAFNRGDADAFAQTYASHASITSPLSSDPPLEGREVIRAHYAAMFAAVPGLLARIEQRTVVGSLVTDHEFIHPINVRAVVIYQVERGLIERAWLFGPLPGADAAGRRVATFDGPA